MIKEESIRPSTPVESAAHRWVQVDGEAKPFIVLAAVVIGLFLVGEAIVVHTAQLEYLYKITPWATLSSIHGMLGATLFVAGSIALYLSYRLLTGKLESLRDLKIAAHLTAIGAFAAVVLGNWVYIGYRQPGMAQDYLVQNLPVVHWVFFEFKENIAVFTVPLAVAATFILYHYGPDLNRQPWLRTLVFLLLSLVFLFFLLAFALGAAITKVKPA